MRAGLPKYVFADSKSGDGMIVALMIRDDTKVASKISDGMGIDSTVVDLRFSEGMVVHTTGASLVIIDNKSSYLCKR